MKIKEFYSNFKEACAFCKRVNGTLEVKFNHGGLRYFVVRYKGNDNDL